MQHTWNFPLDPAHTSLEEAIKSSLSSQQKELEIFLSLYTKSDGAVAEQAVYEALIDQASARTGRLVVSLHKVYYNACLNIHETDKEKMTLAFQLNEQKNLLQLSGPEIEERGMDEI